jgi:hypothetical protein
MPDPSLKALTTGDGKRGTWIWYQWWLAVSLNTITRVESSEVASSKTGNKADPDPA